MIMQQTHYFEFQSENTAELIDYTLSSDLLYDPEDLIFLPAIIAGLDEKDITRIKMYVFPDGVIGEIYTLLPDSANEDVDKINKKAMQTARAFIAEMVKEGFCKEAISIKKGLSPVIQSITGQAGA